MSDRIVYGGNVIPFRPRNSVPYLPSDNRGVRHARDDITQHAAASGRTVWPMQVILWLVAAIRPVLVSRKQTVDFGAFDSHMLRDMGLSRHHAAWLESKDGP